MLFWLNISLDWLKNLMEIFLRGLFKCNKILVIVHWIFTISWPLIGQSLCKLLWPNPSLNSLRTGWKYVLGTSPGVIKAWSWFTEFPIFPDFQFVKHIPSICGQSLLIGLASDLLKMSTILSQFSCNARWDFQKFPCNSHSILCG